MVVELPFVDAIKTSPAFRRYVKRMVSNNVNLDEGVMMLSAKCSAILTNTIPKKLPDPGSFVLD